MLLWVAVDTVDQRQAHIELTAQDPNLAAINIQFLQLQDFHQVLEI